jgi:hypothetical protein
MDVSVIGFPTLAFVVFMLACGRQDIAPTTSQALTLTEVLNASPRTLRLTAALSDADNQATTLFPDLQLHDTVEIGHVADVTTFSDGRFAILDRLNDRIVLYNALGTPIRVIGRAGPGPGELGDPVALTTVNGHLVVWDLDRARAFAVFDTLGAAIATSRASVSGDWLSYVTRSSHRLVDYPYQGPTEDLTSRLIPFDSLSYIHALQSDEQTTMTISDGGRVAQQHMFLIRYDLGGHVLDTLAELSAPASIKKGEVLGRIVFDQPELVSRPMWATGSAWLALGHGDSTAVTVYNTLGKPLLRLELADRQRRLSDEERETWANWAFEIVRETSRDKSWIENIGRRRYARRIRDIVTFTERAPLITALHGDGVCLWMSGFSVADDVLGHSHTLVVVNVEAGAIEGIYRIPRRRARVRTIARQGVYTTYRDSLGLFHLERWPTSGLRC